MVKEGSSCQDLRRRTLTDLLFLPRTSSIVGEEEECDTREAKREARLRRTTNLNVLNRKNARNIGSTVLFPRVVDDYSLGFE